MRNSNGNTFSFIPHVYYFSYHPSIAASDTLNLTTLFTTKMRGRKQSHKNINIPVPFYQNSVTPSLPSVKTIRKTLDRACETLTLTWGFAFFSGRCSKESVSRLLTVNWSEHFIQWGCFQIFSGNNNTSLLLYACEVIHLISKGVISPYVQEQGGILFKLNILCLHYVTHYCA